MAFMLVEVETRECGFGWRCWPRALAGVMRRVNNKLQGLWMYIQVNNTDGASLGVEWHIILRDRSC